MSEKENFQQTASRQRQNLGVEHADR